MLRSFVWACTVVLIAAALPRAAGAADKPAPYPLFGGRFLDFERTGGKVVGVYTPNWEPVALVDRLAGGNVTHLLYAFLRICGPGSLAKDAPKCEGKRDFELGTSAIDRTFNDAFARLKQRAPHVKVVASVGGWGGSDPFFHLANDAARRAVFVQAALGFLREHAAFDGIDIDWEHPTNNGAANGVQLGSQADGQGYADLMLDLRRGLDSLSAETGKPYLLTTAVNPTDGIVSKINFRAAAPALDLVFMMTYDYHGAWSATAGHHAALRASAPNADDGLDASVRNFTRAGVPANKLVAGVAMYGRGFTGVAGPQAGGGFTGAAKQGGYPGPDGSAPYREIASKYLDRQGRGANGYRALFDAQTQSWSVWHARHRLYMGYDDPRTVIDKGRYAVKEGLAGVFAWELSQDNGDILNAMNHGVGNVPLGR